MPGLKTYLLLGTALGTAVFHTLIPDHWLPFVFIGRARHWTVRTTVMISGLSALIHATLSVLLGLFAIWIGVAWAESIGETLEQSSAVLLMGFGAVYAVWAWRKGGHFHPGGRLLHSSPDGAGCGGPEGEFHAEHLHYHADGEMIHGADRRSALYLAVIIGINPCILILPILFSTVSRGAAAVVGVTLVYSATTVLLMVGLSVLGVAGARRLPVPGIARHMESASGLLIALTGLIFLVLE